MPFIEFEKSVHTNAWSMQNLHSHPHYEIYFLKSGERSFFLSNALFKLEAPIILIIPPHALHKTEGGAFERYNVNISPNYLDDYQKEILQRKALHILSPTALEMQRFVEHLETAIKERNSKHGENIARVLFSYLVFLLDKVPQDEFSPKAITKESIPPIILKIIDYLNEHYAEKITLALIAEKFFLSKTALSYAFKKHIDCSLIDFLLSIRITKAKEYLLNSKKSVETIAELCGFSSANYFGLIFKQKENLSPTQYRKHQNTKI